MNNTVISKDSLQTLLDEMAKDIRLAAPVKVGKNLEFAEVKSAAEVVFSDELPYKSPKQFLFPQVEKILTFDKDDVRPGGEPPEMVIFGVKPCDLDALKVLTEVFMKGAFKDPFFAARLDKTVTIGVGCNERKPGCFCQSREVDMAFSENCDVFLAADGDGYVVEHVSDRGREFLKKYLPELECANERKPAENPDTLALDTGIGELEYFNKVNWEQKTEICQACGMCTFICPTCHCFEFKDITKNGITNRYRCWDSCMYPKFTLHASGHNPRVATKDRYRQRVLHKYLYVKQNLGCTACTGCGRCVRSCPAGMNIRKVASEIAAESGKWGRN